MLHFFQSRAVSAQIAETDVARFFVGTQTLKFTNQIHLVELNDETGAVNTKVIFKLHVSLFLYILNIIVYYRFTKFKCS